MNRDLKGDKGGGGHRIETRLRPVGPPLAVFYWFKVVCPTREPAPFGLDSRKLSRPIANGMISTFARTKMKRAKVGRTLCVVSESGVSRD